MDYTAPRLLNVSQLTRRFLWNRTVRGTPRPLPVIVLLGPVGSGKTLALRSISDDCGSSVVHTDPYDFGKSGAEDSAGPAATISVLAVLASDLSRNWKARPKAKFQSFTLGWIAAHQNHVSSVDGLRRAIDGLTRGPDKKIHAAVAELVDSAVNIRMPGSTGDTLKAVLPSLIQALGQHPLRQARRWPRHSSGAQGPPMIEKLYALNRLASRGDEDAVTASLMDDFLSDVRESYEPMAMPDAKSSCRCETPVDGPHLHNWLVLLDNVDRPAGARFIADLLAARERYQQRDSGKPHDPLLIIATSGRWDRSWESWRPIWESEPVTADGLRAVRTCRNASYANWAGSSDDSPKSAYYPVLLEPMTDDDIAQILKIDRYSPECRLVRRATGGLPGAVEQIKPLIRGREIEPGTRDALAAAPDPQHPEVNPWHERLGRLRLLDHLPGCGIDDFVNSAPFATAPWLIPHDVSLLVSQDKVGRILTELRTALWVSAPKDRTATHYHAELHPWLASTLNSSLTWSTPGQQQSSYDMRFEKLLADQEKEEEEPVRQAYCHLALGKIGKTVDILTSTFDDITHKEWMDQLRLVTSAPDNLPPGETCRALYEKLVYDDNQHCKEDRSRTRNTIARLIAARRLYVNHFTMPDPELKSQIESCYADLRVLSRRPDVGDLGIDYDI